MKTYKPVNKYEIKVIKSVFKEQNILELLKLGPHTRDEMVEKLGIPRTTIYDHLYRLIKKNKVIFEDHSFGKQGRPLRYFKLKQGRLSGRLYNLNS